MIVNALHVLRASTEPRKSTHGIETLMAQLMARKLPTAHINGVYVKYVPIPDDGIPGMEMPPVLQMYVEVTAPGHKSRRFIAGYSGLLHDSGIIISGPGDTGDVVPHAQNAADLLRQITLKCIELATQRKAEAAVEPQPQEQRSTLRQYGGSYLGFLSARFEDNKPDAGFYEAVRRLPGVNVTSSAHTMNRDVVSIVDCYVKADTPERFRMLVAAIVSLARKFDADDLRNSSAIKPVKCTESLIKSVNESAEYMLMNGHVRKFR